VLHLAIYLQRRAPDVCHETCFRLAQEYTTNAPRTRWDRVREKCGDAWARVESLAETFLYASEFECADDDAAVERVCASLRLGKRKR
jgi:hypothetical protein